MWGCLLGLLRGIPRGADFRLVYYLLGGADSIDNEHACQFSIQVYIRSQELLLQ